MTEIHHWPRGFGGSVQNWQAVQPTAPALVLPCREAKQDDPAVPPGPHPAVVVQGLAESFGVLESFLNAVSRQLADGGEVLLDFANAQTEHAARVALEGRPPAVDPCGSLSDPERAVSLPRLLRALTGAGLHVQDLWRVPPFHSGIDRDLIQALLVHGVHAIGCLPDPQPGRFWLRASRTVPCAGTVLIGIGNSDQQERTARAVRAFLPSDWQLSLCTSDREPAAWNRAIGQALGERVWLLRAGSEPTLTAFQSLLTASTLNPVVPGGQEQPQHPGDITGLMVLRNDLFLAGPLAEQWRNDSIVYEDYLMRLEARARTVQVANCQLDSPSVPGVDSEHLPDEGREMLARWEVLQTSRASAKPRPKPSSGTRQVPWAGRKPRISLVMMTKNEEKFLPDCLRRALPAVDELVIVDTGSTDSTVEIAKQFGAKVLHTTWTDDFSAPRNLGLAAATGDWVLILDADEVLRQESIELLREAVLDETASAFNVRFYNEHGEGKPIAVVMVRLFRRLPGLSWCNRIHEQISPSLIAVGRPLGLEIKSCEVAVDHLGYLPEVMIGRSKQERNERLFRMQLAEKPEDVYVLYKFGDFLRRMPGRAADSHELLSKAMQLLLEAPPLVVREVPYASEIAALVALHHMHDGAGAKAQEVIDQALHRFIPTPNIHYIAGSMALLAQRPDEAIAQFERCLAYRDQVLVVPIQEGITSHVAIAGIGQAYLQKGDRARARRWLEQSLQLNGAHEPAVVALSRVLCEMGEVGRGLHVLTEFLAEHPEAVAACEQAARILAGIGLPTQARTMGLRARELLNQRGLHREAQKLQTTVCAVTECQTRNP